MVLEAEKSKSTALAPRRAFLTRRPVAEGRRVSEHTRLREKIGLNSFFLSGTQSSDNSINPFMRERPSRPNHFFKVPLLNLVTMAITFQHEFWRGHSILAF